MIVAIVLIMTIIVVIALMMTIVMVIVVIAMMIRTGLDGFFPATSAMAAKRQRSAKLF